VTVGLWERAVCNELLPHLPAPVCKIQFNEAAHEIFEMFGKFVFSIVSPS
jgi:hypothetical protein